jgi:hypothetical protein
VDALTTAQAAIVAGIDVHNAAAMVPRLARTVRKGHDAAVDGDQEWSAGEVVAIAVVRALDPHCTNPETWAAGAGQVGAAHERGLCPVYLVTAGGPDYCVVLDGDAADRTAVRAVGELVARGQCARVVPVTPIVEHLCDVLEVRATA